MGLGKDAKFFPGQSLEEQTLKSEAAEMVSGIERVIGSLHTGEMATWHLPTSPPTTQQGWLVIWGNLKKKFGRRKLQLRGAVGVGRTG